MPGRRSGGAVSERQKIAGRPGAQAGAAGFKPGRPGAPAAQGRAGAFSAM